MGLPVAYRWNTMLRFRFVPGKVWACSDHQTMVVVVSRTWWRKADWSVVRSVLVEEKDCNKSSAQSHFATKSIVDTVQASSLCKRPVSTWCTYASTFEESEDFTLR